MPNREMSVQRESPRDEGSQGAWVASCGIPPPLVGFLHQALVIVLEQGRPRQALERLLARACGLVAPRIHLTGEPLALGYDRALVPGGSEALRVTCGVGQGSADRAGAAVGLLLAFEPLLREAEQRAETRCALAVMKPTQGDLLGVSPVMRDLHDRIDRAARKSFIVMVQGESGSGKELVARRVHALSNRRGGPFIPLNCAAIVESLLEAELFGIEERTATGVRGRRGKFEQADGGTLFLDEVSDLSSAAQAKLLRVIQDSTIERVGGHGSRRVDVRIVVASNRPLEPLCRSGEFRWDLFYRLNAIEIVVPPLRARRDDIPFLVEAILDRTADGQPFRLSVEAMEALMVHDWPGNVRELERVIERAITLARSPVIRLDDLPAAVTGRYHEAFRPDESADESMRAWGSRYARYVLGRTGGNKREACRILNISYHTLCAYLAYDGRRSSGVSISDAARQDDPVGRSATGPVASGDAYRLAPGSAPDVVHDRPGSGLDTGGSRNYPSKLVSGSSSRSIE